MSTSPILTVIKDGSVIKTCAVDDHVILGRSQDCTIWLDNRAISREHALFRKVGEELHVEKKSEFGVLVVNGIECTRAVLKPADIVSVGPYTIQVSFPTSSTPARSSPISSISSRPSNSPQEIPALPSDLVQGAPPVNELGVEPHLSLENNFPGDHSSLEKGSLEKSSLLENDLLGNESLQNGSLQQNGSSLENQPFLDAPVSLEDSSQQLLVQNSLASPQGNSDSHESSSSSSNENSSMLEMPESAELDKSSPLLAPPQESPSGQSQASAEVDDDAKTKIVATGKVAVRLIFKPDTANFTEYELTREETSIGRGKDCDIILNDKKASRKNAIIRRAGANFLIKDLGSANGTYVNGAKISELELSGDDVIKIGNVEFTFKASSTDYAAKEKDFVSIPQGAEEFAADQPAENSISLGQYQIPQAPSNPALEMQGFPPSSTTSNPPLGLPSGGAPLNGIPGITGISGGKSQKMGIIEKFHAASPAKKVLYLLLLAAIVYFGVFDEDVVEKQKLPKKKSAKVVEAPKAKGVATFDSLLPEQKQFVIAQHDLAFNYYKNKEYDKALFEIQKIFDLGVDYQDSREIERYAREGKRKLDAIEEERKKKEEEAALKKKINDLVEETKKLMDQKYYEQAKELFSQILAFDPDNASVTEWRKIIEDYEEQQKTQSQQKQVQAEINKHAWELFREAVSMMKSKKYHSAIHTFQSVVDIGASDKKLRPAVSKKVAFCRSQIRKLRDPVLAQAKHHEEAGEYSEAFKLFQKAARIDPTHPEGYAGMNRIRGILHERAKMIYTEAILAESFSDFTNARKLFEECQKMAPPDDMYHDRAARKLAHYFKREESPQQ